MLGYWGVDGVLGLVLGLLAWIILLCLGQREEVICIETLYIVFAILSFEKMV